MKLLGFIASFLIEKKAFAHCDIPCGIYDPHNAQVAAHTVIRMTQLIKDLEADINAPFEERKKIIHNISRQTRIKEKHAGLLEEELTTLRNIFFFIYPSFSKSWSLLDKVRGLMLSSSFWSCPKRFVPPKREFKIRSVHLLPIIFAAFDISSKLVSILYFL